MREPTFYIFSIDIGLLCLIEIYRFLFYIKNTLNPLRMNNFTFQFVLNHFKWAKSTFANFDFVKLNEIVPRNMKRSACHALT